MRGADRHRRRFSLTYFFYSPFYTFTPADRSRVLGVVFFLLVSLVSGYLASRTRRDAARALKRENEIRDLYTFSQRLSAANSPAGIFEAMQQHLGTLVGRKVLLFDLLGTLEAKSERLGDAEFRAACRMRSRHCRRRSPIARVVSSSMMSAAALGWSVRFRLTPPISASLPLISAGDRTPSTICVRVSSRSLPTPASRWSGLVWRAHLAEARTRAETEQFREALIGSVSHELRTPLSSILGASTVLSLAPEVAGDTRLKKLAALIHQESERLNAEIENILDASRISSNGLLPKLEWAEPADFINAALQRCRNRLANRAVEVTLPEELVLLRIDSVLMERVLGQILDNAAKYSPPELVDHRSWAKRRGAFYDRGYRSGRRADADDRALLGQKFFRGQRHAQNTSGLGLGFWIASAFVAANNGTLEAASAV